MDSSTKLFSLILFLVTLSSSLQTHARDSQFFNKVPAATTTNAVDEAKQPKFLPDNGNTYGLYAHDSAAAEKPLHDYFPKNYNAAALDQDINEPAFTKESIFTSNPNTNNYYNGGGGFQAQGMSDTRFLENGKYFYDVNTERYSRNHPYQVMRGDQARNDYYNKNFYGNGRNAYEFNGDGYQNQDVFDDEFNNLP